MEQWNVEFEVTRASLIEALEADKQCALDERKKLVFIVHNYNIAASIESGGFTGVFVSSDEEAEAVVEIFQSSTATCSFTLIPILTKAQNKIIENNLKDCCKAIIKDGYRIYGKSVADGKRFYGLPENSDKIISEIEKFANSLSEQGQKECLKIIRTLADVEEKPVDWLWFPYIPKGKITFIYADPGTGKTQLECALAAAVSTGGNLPDGSRAKYGRVILFNSEDDFADTIKPRMRKQGANCKNIILPENRQAENFQAYTLGDDRLEILLKEYTPELVIFDPLASYLGANTNMNAANETRPIFDKLLSIAEKFNVAILIVAHTNKNSLSPVFNRLSGSGDFVAAARSTLFLGRHPQNPDVKILFHMKSNLARFGENIAFKFNDEGVLILDPDTDVSGLTADECSKQGKVRNLRTQKANAAALIEDVFEGKNEISVLDLHELAEKFGIDWQTFRKAKPDYLVTKNRGTVGSNQYFWVRKIPIGTNLTLDDIPTDKVKSYQ